MSEKTKCPDTIKQIGTCNPIAEIDAYCAVLKHHRIETDDWIDFDGIYHLEFAIPKRREGDQSVRVMVETTLPSCDSCGVYVVLDGTICVCTHCYQKFLVCEKCQKKDRLELCDCLTARDD